MLWETRDAAESQIMFQDIASESNTAVFRITTPFSAHFPWTELSNFPVCDSKQMKAVQKKFPQDITYFIDHVPNLDFDVVDVCANNYFFRNRNSSACQEVLA